MEFVEPDPLEWHAAVNREMERLKGETFAAIEAMMAADFAREIMAGDDSEAAVWDPTAAAVRRLWLAAKQASPQ